MSRVIKSWRGVFKKNWLPLTMVVSLSGCTSMSTADEMLSVKTDPSRPPNFSQPLEAAMAQMSYAQAAQMSAELSALGQGHRAGAISEADYWARVGELEALAAQHGANTISRIEDPQ